MQAQREAPPYMQCKDKFLVQSAIVAEEIILPKEVTGDMVTCSLACFMVQYLSFPSHSFDLVAVFRYIYYSQ
jgi:hypothetical protein